MINIVDEACNVAGRQILTYEQSGVEALKSFGHAISRRAILPLEEHYHQDCLELVFLIKGTQVYTVDKKDYSIYGLSGFISYPNEVHGTGAYPQNVSEIYWIQLDISNSTSILGLSDLESKRLCYDLINSTCRIFQFDNEMVKMISTAFESISSNNECAKRIGTALLVVILNKIVLFSQSDRAFLQGHGTISKQIIDAIEYIEDNIEDLLMLEAVASITGLSLSRFKSKFKEEIGVTPREFINKQKIERAKLMLADGKSVIDTAMELSFSSSSYFSVTFKKFTTITPTDFCKNIITDANKTNMD